MSRPFYMHCIFVTIRRELAVELLACFLVEIFGRQAASSEFTFNVSGQVPYRLIISPNQYGAWAHASTPVSSQAGRTELWHTLGKSPCRGRPDRLDPEDTDLFPQSQRDPGA
jgi:hypothetical protein